MRLDFSDEELTILAICFCPSILDELDFISSIAASDTTAFSLHSSPGDTLCIIISLLNDTFYESNENFIVELSTRDPSVIISEDANLAVVTIGDIPHPLCKLMQFLLAY